MANERYDELQTAACRRVDAYVDGILRAVSEIRHCGIGSDRASDLLSAIREDAGRAFAVNSRIAADDLSECDGTEDYNARRALHPEEFVDD